MKVCLSLMTIGVFGLFGAWVPVGSVTAPTPPEVKVIRADETEAVLEINLYGFEVDRITARGVNYDLIRLPGEMTSQDVGKPEVPRIPRAICIPNEARVVATILESEKVVLKDYNLYPAQRPLTDLDIELPFEIDHIAYASDRLFPAQPVDIWNQGQWRDVYIANTDIYPIQFNPLRGELTVYTHLVIRYSYLGGKGYPEAVEPEFAAMYRSIMCNYDCLGIRVEKFLTPGVRYLVFCPTKYYNTARRLIDWHHKQGFKTKVIQATSFPTPQAIKDSIQAEYNSNNPRILKWVLLVGDVADVATYTAWGCPASDIWYCDFDANLYAECGISRLSVQDTLNLRNQINKILKFIQNPPTTNSWLTKVVHVAHKELYPDKYSGCVRGIYNYRYNYYRYTMDTMMGAIAGNTNAALQAKINEGRVVVNYRGHGLQTAWDAWGADNQQWQISHINGLNNGDLTPVVHNCACYCGQINYSSPCLSEGWMDKYPGGAVASLGASNPSYTYANHCYDSTFFIALGDTMRFVANGVTWRAPLWDIAWVMNYAGANMVMRHGSSTGGENYKMYIFLGDPAMEIWTGPATPTRLSVTHPTLINVGAQNFPVSVAGPLSGVLVCVSKGTEVYATAYTNSAGRCTLAINPTTAGTMDVTATLHGYLPYEGTCTVRLGVEEKPGIQVTERIAITTAPFGKNVRIVYAVPKRTRLTIKVFDITGRMVGARLTTVEGSGHIDWNTQLPSGIYFVKVQTDREYTRKIVLTR